MKHLNVLIWILIVCLIWFSSCINSKKASNYMRNHPDVAAPICADLFPVKTKTDTRAFDSSMAVIDSLIEVIATSEHISESEKGDLISEINRLQTARPDCDSVVAPVKELADRESKRASDLALSNKQLQAAAKNVKPIRDTIENTAKVAHLQNQLQQCADDKIGLTNKLAKVTEQRDDYKSSARKWKFLFWLLIAIAVVFVFRKNIFPFLKIFKMKSIIILLLLSVTLFSCSSLPDNKIHKVDIVHVGFEPGSTVFHPVNEVIDTSYAIEPTWGQAVNFAFQGGYGLWFFLGFVSLASFGWLFYTHAKDLPIIKGWDPKANIRWFLIVITLVAAFVCFLAQPTSVRQSNRKWVPKEQYEYYMQRDGNIKAIWDSLRDNKLIEGGKHK